MNKSQQSSDEIRRPVMGGGHHRRHCTNRALLILIGTIILLSRKNDFAARVVQAVNLQANRTCSIVVYIPFTDLRIGTLDAVLEDVYSAEFERSRGSNHEDHDDHDDHEDHHDNHSDHDDHGDHHNNRDDLDDQDDHHNDDHHDDHGDHHRNLRTIADVANNPSENIMHVPGDHPPNGAQERVMSDHYYHKTEQRDLQTDDHHEQHDDHEDDHHDDHEDDHHDDHEDDHHDDHEDDHEDHRDDHHDDHQDDHDDHQDGHDDHDDDHEDHDDHHDDHHGDHHGEHGSGGGGGSGLTRHFDEYGYGEWPSAEILARASFSLMAAAELAKRHFNDRNSVLVTDLEEAIWLCDIRLGSAGGGGGYFDSGYSRLKAVDQLMAFRRQSILETSGGGYGAESVCAVVGPLDTLSNEGIAALTESMAIPQIAYGTTSTHLSNRDDFPTFARTVTDMEGFAYKIAKYIQRDVWRREYVAILYDQTDYAEQFVVHFQDASTHIGWTVISEHFRFNDGHDHMVEDALRRVVKAGYHTVILVTDRRSVVEEVAANADRLGLLDDVVWILTGDVLRPEMLDSVKYRAGSAVDRLLLGAAIFTNYDRFVYFGESDPFLQMWRQQNSSLVEELNGMQPRNESSGGLFYEAPPDYFQTVTPAVYASFVYDAVVAIGIGACQADDAKNSEGGQRVVSHMDKMLETEFQGASGPFRFKYDPLVNAHGNSRDPSTVYSGVYNIRAGSIDDQGLRRYESVLTARYSDHYTYTRRNGKKGYGAWQEVEGTQFLFADGTPTEPMPLRTVMDEHYLTKGVQVAGLSLSGIALAISVFSASWVFAFRHSATVKVSQPEFLYLLCFGAALVGSSTIFLSFDEEKGWSRSQLDHACSAFPWFFVIGYLSMYCAIFCKLWRLRKVMSMQRQAIHFQQALWPFVIIITLSVIVLITWQSTDPLTWEVDVISDDPLETYGSCKSVKNGILPYVIPLGILFATIMVLSAVMAWELKGVQEELSESRWIFFGIVTHIQTWAIGIPVVMITQGVSKDAFYLMQAALAFIFSTSLVTLVIWPKIFALIVQAYSKHGQKNEVTVSIGHHGLTRVSGLNDTNAFSSASSGRAGSILLSSIRESEGPDQVPRDSHDDESFREWLSTTVGNGNGDAGSRATDDHKVRDLTKEEAPIESEANSGGDDSSMSGGNDGSPSGGNDISPQSHEDNQSGSIENESNGETLGKRVSSQWKTKERQERIAGAMQDVLTEGVQSSFVGGSASPIDE